MIFYLSVSAVRAVSPLIGGEDTQTLMAIIKLVVGGC